MPTHQHFGGQAALALYIHDTGEGEFGELELRLGRQLMKTRLGWLCVSVRIIRFFMFNRRQTDRKLQSTRKQKHVRYDVWHAKTNSNMLYIYLLESTLASP